MGDQPKVDKNIDRLKNTTIPEVRSESINDLMTLVSGNPCLDLGQKGISVLLTLIRTYLEEDVDLTRTALQILQTVLNPPPTSVQNTALQNADMLLQANVLQLLFRLVDCKDMFIRLFTIQIFLALHTLSPEPVEQGILALRGVDSFVQILADRATEEALRNEVILLLLALSRTSEPLQTLVAFQGALEACFGIVFQEGLDEGSIVVSDCLQVMLSVLKSDLSKHALELVRVLLSSEKEITAMQEALHGAGVTQGLLAVVTHRHAPDQAKQMALTILARAIRGHLPSQASLMQAQAISSALGPRPSSQSLQSPLHPAPTAASAPLTYLTVLALSASTPKYAERGGEVASHQLLFLREAAFETLMAFLEKNADGQLFLAQSFALPAPPQPQAGRGSGTSGVVQGPSAGWYLAQALLSCPFAVTAAHRLPPTATPDDLDSSLRTTWNASLLIARILRSRPESKSRLLSCPAPAPLDQLPGVDTGGGLLPACIRLLMGLLATPPCGGQQQQGQGAVETPLAVVIGVMYLIAQWLEECPGAVGALCADPRAVWMLVDLITGKFPTTGYPEPPAPKSPSPASLYPPVPVPCLSHPGWAAHPEIALFASLLLAEALEYHPRNAGLALSHHELLPRLLDPSLQQFVQATCEAVTRRLVAHFQEGATPAPAVAPPASAPAPPSSGAVHPSSSSPSVSASPVAASPAPESETLTAGSPGHGKYPSCIAGHSTPFGHSLAGQDSRPSLYRPGFESRSAVASPAPASGPVVTNQPAPVGPMAIPPGPAVERELTRLRAECAQRTSELEILREELGMCKEMIRQQDGALTKSRTEREQLIKQHEQAMVRCRCPIFGCIFFFWMSHNFPVRCLLQDKPHSSKRSRTEREQLIKQHEQAMLFFFFFWMSHNFPDLCQPPKSPEYTLIFLVRPIIFRPTVTPQKMARDCDEYCGLDELRIDLQMELLIFCTGETYRILGGIRPPDCDREVLFGVQRVPRGVFRCRISFTIFTETLSDPQSLRTL
ncbi:general vesicular transport factor [Paratrimastix pyriformis]|uniref:General vesicular transport factor n=1 Tax=Paratrimastix pyriformis TaxID=342808 RepID=A0ABQ8UJJ9_9EUKA|nr:general vesicular transport factor [Paratrimastix pyriformis]